MFTFKHWSSSMHCLPRLFSFILAGRLSVRETDPSHFRSPDGTASPVNGNSQMLSYTDFGACGHNHIHTPCAKSLLGKCNQDRLACSWLPFEDLVAGVRAGVPDFLCVSSTRVSVLVAVKRSVYPLCIVAQLFVPLDFRPTAKVLALIVDPGVAVQLPQQCIAVVRWFASTWQGYLPNLKVGFERLKKHRIFGGAGNGY